MFLERHWHLPENRKTLFDNFARETGFDPLIPKNWYAVARETVMDFKVLWRRKDTSG
jgi:hypothetical protein